MIRSTAPAFLAAVASAALLAAPATLEAQSTQIAFELGLGTRIAPAYEGSDDYEAGAAFTGALNTLSFGALSVGGGQTDTTGFSFGPSFGLISSRTDADHSELKGIDDVDWSLELGVRAGYKWQNAEVNAAIRKAVTGHDGVVGELSANAIFRPDSATTIHVGPELTFANDTYADAYFSVPSSSKSFNRYSADGGLKSVGANFSLRRELSDTWAIRGDIEYFRLTGDFEDSPITKSGSRDQVKVGVMLIRQFDWRF